MDRVLFFGGIAGVFGGFSVILYQGIMFLKIGSWDSYSLFSAIDKGPRSLSELVAAYPGLMNALQSCPLSLGLIVIGCLLMWGSSRLGNRYA